MLLGAGSTSNSSPFLHGEKVLLMCGVVQSDANERLQLRVPAKYLKGKCLRLAVGDGHFVGIVIKERLVLGTCRNVLRGYMAFPAQLATIKELKHM